MKQKKCNTLSNVEAGTTNGRGTYEALMRRLYPMGVEEAQKASEEFANQEMMAEVQRKLLKIQIWWWVWFAQCSRIR